MTLDSSVWIVIFGTLLFLFLIVVTILIIVLSNQRRIRHEKELVQTKLVYEKELMKTQIEVAENTLNDIARDLHDDVGQMLAFTIMQLNHLKNENYSLAKDKIEDVQESVQNTLQSVRGISKSLSNDYIRSFGIYESLQHLFARLAKQESISPILVFSKEVLFHSKSNELFAFRIIQELINNTIKHAEAKDINLTIREENSIITIDYSDNGKGMNDELIKTNSLPDGLGFTNMKKRAELMKGKISIESGSGKGFHFQLTFPNE